MAVLGVSTTSCLPGTGGGGGDRRGAPCHCCQSASRGESQTCCQQHFFFTRSLREWKYFPSERYFFPALCETIRQSGRHFDPLEAEERERKDESADGSELFTQAFKFSGMQENTVWRIYRPQRAGRAEAHLYFLREARTASISVCLLFHSLLL